MNYPVQKCTFHIDEKTDFRSLPTVLDHQPNYIWLEPTNRCNTRCRHCRHYYEKFGEDMDVGLYKKIRDALIDHLDSVELIGYGEPFLARAYPQMFEDFQQRGIKTGSTTNGILLRKEELTAKLVRGNMEVHLSIDGASKETYEFVRPLIKWEQMLETLETLKRCRDDAGAQADRFRLRFNFVAMKQNIGDLPELVRLAHRYGAYRILVFPLANHEGFAEVTGQSLQDSPELVSPAFIEALKEARRLGVDLKVPASFHELIFMGAERGHSLRGKLARWTRKAKLFPVVAGKNGWLRTIRKAIHYAPTHDEGAYITYCALPWTGAYFASDGQVFPCCVINEKMGDMNRQSWADIWNGQAWRALRLTSHSWNPTFTCRHCGLPTGINGGDDKHYEKFFGQFQIHEIPLDDAGVRFGEGFFQLENDEATGAVSHCWMGRKGRLALPARRDAIFIRLKIIPRWPERDQINIGRCRINGGHWEPFDNTCEEVHFPVKNQNHARDWELEIEMENGVVTPPDTRELSLGVRAIHILT